jgi:toxin-antitoxin system PIN domain toxin
VIALDTNLLVHAHRSEGAEYSKAKRLLQDLAEGTAAWAVPWQCFHEFFGVVTNPRLFRPPTPRAAALAQIEAWLASPSLVVLCESARHWATLKPLINGGEIDGPKIHDARIAALCLQHGVRELWSADRDFKRFPELTVRNPLVG